MRKWTAGAMIWALSAAPACAQGLEDQSRALAEIRRTAITLCPTVDNTSQATRAEAKAQVEATLPGLLRRLMNIGANASGSYANSQSRGVLQDQLAALITSTNTCRLEVLRMLQDKMLQDPVPRIVPGTPISPRPLARPTITRQLTSKAATSLQNARTAENRQPTLPSPAPIRQTGPTLKVFFKNNLTGRDMAQLAKLLPTWKVVPGGRSLVDPSAAADALFVNRDVIDRTDVVSALRALSAIGVPIRAVIPSYVGGRREIQVGTIVNDSPDGQTSSLNENEYLSISKLETLQGSAFWRAAWNEAGFCGSRLNTAGPCTLDENARPVFTENTAGVLQ